jgi:diguanylate cyclase (GGDEF)-like protein/PAS domain S-box-containing protein
MVRGNTVAPHKRGGVPYSRLRALNRTAAVRRVVPWITFLGLTLLAVVIGVTVGARALIGSFEQVEAAATAQKAAQVYRAFEADLRQLAISNRDYAEWDDAEAFYQDRNPRFVPANFNHDALAGMHVDVVWIVDAQGNEIYSCIASRNSQNVISPAPRNYLDGLHQFVAAGRARETLPPVENVVVTPRGLTAVAINEIRRSNGSGRTGAHMVFARYIQEADIQRVRETSQLPVTMIPLAAQPLPLPPTVRKWLDSGSYSNHVFVDTEDENSISGYAVVVGMDAHPIALFRTRGPREFYAVGSRTTWLMLAGIVVLFVTFGVAIIGLMMRLQRSFAARQSVEMRYRNIAAQLREAILVIDGSTLEIVEVNEAALRALGCERDALHTRTVQDIFPEVTRLVLDNCGKSESDRIIQLSRERRQGGGWVDAEVTITPLTIHGRTMLTLVGHDISHRKEAEEQERRNRRKLAKLAEQDALTGLPNRLYLHNRLPQVLAKVAAGQRLLALIYVDVDNFKNINDSRGHGCGDQLLQVVAKRMRAALAAHDLVARMGGDEFVVVASLLPDAASIESLALRLRTAVSAPIAIDAEALSVTASLGVAVFPNDGPDVKTLLKHADIALYQAKEAGRNCHRYFCADMDLRFSEHVAIEQALRHAVGTSQIFMEYQPVIDLRTGRVASLEALMRWRHPERGVIPPGQFIPVAEKTGLIVELGLQALTEVVRQIRAWLDAEVPIVPIAVNVSPLQFDRTHFAAEVARVAAAAEVDPRWLKFEITESALMKEPDKLIGTLQTLRKLGSHVLIDDFGTGFSSLSYLDRLPVDALKIDQAFVRNLEGASAKTPIIDAVLDLAQRLRLTTVAEGVETAEQAAMLKSRGCDFAQGYFYSKPVAARHCLKMLQELKRERPLTETLLVRAIAAE